MWRVVVVVLLSGCGLFDQSSSGSSTVTLAAETTDGETGTAVLTSLSSGTEVSITTSGGTDTGVQSAVIRAGACGGGGDLKEELNNVQSNQSVTTLTDSLSDLTGGKYAVEIHSSTNVSTIVACGVIP